MGSPEAIPKIYYLLLKEVINADSAMLPRRACLHLIIDWKVLKLPVAKAQRCQQPGCRTQYRILRYHNFPLVLHV